MVEHNLAKVGVEGSNPFARSKNFQPNQTDSSSAHQVGYSLAARGSTGEAGGEIWAPRGVLIASGMGISNRHYLFLEDGSLRRIPQRIANELPFGRDAIPEFAGTRQRVVNVVLELQDAKPVRILNARGSYFEFDDEGRVDEHLRNSMADRMDIAFAPRAKSKGTVVDLVPEIKRRELDARDRWTLSADDLDKIAADLWPGVHGPAPEVSTVKGVRSLLLRAKAPVEGDQLAATTSQDQLDADMEVSVTVRSALEWRAEDWE